MLCTVWICITQSLAGPQNYNNFLVFRGVFDHLFSSLPLYEPYPLEYGDINHYGPIFAFIIAPFAVLPPWLGMSLWCMSLSLLLYWTVRQLPMPVVLTSLVLWLTLNDFYGACFKQQFNIAVAALVVGALAMIEKRREGWAALFIVIGTFVKIYGIVGLAFFFFVRRKGRFIGYMALWSAMALLLPLLFSCIVHGLLGRVLPWDAALVKALWAAGEELTSGGVLGGVLAQGSVQVFSRLGSTILFVLAFLLAGLGAFRLSLAEVADWIFDRPRYEYEPEEEPERPRRSKREERPAAPEPVRTPSRRADIDIPVEDGPLVGKTAQTAPEVKKKGSFFNRKANVPAPDQVLAGAEQRTAEQPAPAPEPA
uniref:glycosyltransferase family 87 protein n=1 Tax=Alistipes shahii TaxID=328814 RepID=UPI003FED72FD